MQVRVKPCPYRLVDNDGHILCNQIKTGERQISLATCQACPVAQIGCAHLRAALRHPARSPLIVRWGNGKTEIWDEPAPPVTLERAACSAKTIPILSPRDCAGCTLRQALIASDSIPEMPSRVAAPALRPSPSPRAASTAALRANTVAHKILQLSEWLGQKKAKTAQEEGFGMLPITHGIRPVRAAAEEKRAGWTD